jgi:hypothetical protein
MVVVEEEVTVVSVDIGEDCLQVGIARDHETLTGYRWRGKDHGDQ